MKSGDPPVRSADDVRLTTIRRRLELFSTMSTDESELLKGQTHVSLFAANSYLQLGDDSPPPRYLIEGWVAWLREVDNGRRQFVQLFLPGDPVNPHRHIIDNRDIVVCLTPVRLIDGGKISLAADDRARYPGIALAVASATAERTARLADQAMRLGRQTALERMAHLMIETRHRLAAVDQLSSDSIPFPLTQEQIGDLLGLSVVHVNRTLQNMRRKGWIALSRTRLNFLDLPAVTRESRYRSPSFMGAAEGAA